MRALSWKHKTLGSIPSMTQKETHPLYLQIAKAACTQLCGRGSSLTNTAVSKQMNIRPVDSTGLCIVTKMQNHEHRMLSFVLFNCASSLKSEKKLHFHLSYLITKPLLDTNKHYSNKQTKKATYLEGRQKEPVSE